VLNGTKDGACEKCKWNGTKIFDCRGFTYDCLKEAGAVTLAGGGCSSQYNHNPNWV